MIPKLSKFIQDRIEQVPPAIEFHLTHYAVDALEGSSLLLAAKVKHEGDVEKEVERIVDLFEESSQDHARTFQGSQQRYRVIAFQEKEQRLGSFTFNLGMGQRDADLVGLSEPPTQSGVMAQMMRHTEKMHQMFTEVVGAMTGPLLEENRSLRARQADTEAIRQDYWHKREELATDAFVREQAQRELEADKEIRAQAIQALTAHAPAILQQLAGASSKSGNGSAPAPGNVPTVAMLQTLLRDVFKLIDRTDVYESLEDEDCNTLDGLLGLGEDPPDIVTFRARLLSIWNKLPDATTTSIGEALIEKDPSKAQLLIQLLGRE